MKKILISTSTFGEYDNRPVAKLIGARFEVEMNPYNRKLKYDESLLHYRDKVGVIAGTEVISRDLLHNANSLKVISRCGSGIDNVDINAANQLGIKVFNTPHGPTLAVAELTVGLIPGLLRRVVEMDRDLRNGIWKKRMGNLLHEKKIGIIGYGRIGQKVGELLLKLGCSVSFCDPAVQSCPRGCKCLSLQDILTQSDIVCLHVSGNFVGDPLIRRKEIESMKIGSWLVNCSRGGVVDETALYEALRSNRLSGAAVDVFEEEPYDGKLKELPNIVLSPHIGSYAKEARVAMEMQAVENLLEGLSKERSLVQS